jgi:hypothetical protein
MPRFKGMVIGFWIATTLFCLQMAFTAYAQLRLPQVAEGERLTARRASPFPGWPGCRDERMRTGSADVRLGPLNSVRLAAVGQTPRRDGRRFLSFHPALTRARASPGRR